MYSTAVFEVGFLEAIGAPTVGRELRPFVNGGSSWSLFDVRPDLTVIKVKNW